MMFCASSFHRPPYPQITSSTVASRWDHRRRCGAAVEVLVLQPIPEGLGSVSTLRPGCGVLLCSGPTRELSAARATTGQVRSPTCQRRSPVRFCGPLDLA